MPENSFIFGEKNGANFLICNLLVFCKYSKVDVVRKMTFFCSKTWKLLEIPNFTFVLFLSGNGKFPIVFRIRLFYLCSWLLTRVLRNWQPLRLVTVGTYDLRGVPQCATRLPGRKQLRRKPHAHCKEKSRKTHEFKLLNGKNGKKILAVYFDGLTCRDEAPVALYYNNKTLLRGWVTEWKSQLSLVIVL